MSNFIAGAVKKPGQLHRDLGIPQGTPIPRGALIAAAHKPGKVGQRARLAETLEQLRPGYKLAKAAAGK